MIACMICGKHIDEKSSLPICSPNDINNFKGFVCTDCAHSYSTEEMEEKFNFILEEDMK